VYELGQRVIIRRLLERRNRRWVRKERFVQGIVVGKRRLRGVIGFPGKLAEVFMIAHDLECDFTYVLPEDVELSGEREAVEFAEEALEVPGVLAVGVIYGVQNEDGDDVLRAEVVVDKSTSPAVRRVHEIASYYQTEGVAYIDVSVIPTVPGYAPGDLLVGMTCVFTKEGEVDG